MIRRSLGEAAYTRIKQKILAQEFSSSSYTSENQLVAELGISRTPIREALHRLQTEGWVKVVPKRGVFIQELSTKELVDSYDLRLAIEIFNLRALKGLLEAEHFCVLDDNVARQKQALQEDAHDAWITLDEEFHRYLLELGSNRMFLELADKIRLRTYFKPPTIQRKTYYGASIDEHVAFIAMLKSGDWQQAEQLMERHILRGKARSLEGAASPLNR